MGIEKVAVTVDVVKTVVVSQQPKKRPGVSQVSIEVEEHEVNVSAEVLVGRDGQEGKVGRKVEEDVKELVVEVVLSSRQPHQPGVLQVSVRVREKAVVEVVSEEVVRELLLSLNFHR